MAHPITYLHYSQQLLVGEIVTESQGNHPGLMLEKLCRRRHYIDYSSMSPTRILLQFEKKRPWEDAFSLSTCFPARACPRFIAGRFCREEGGQFCIWLLQLPLGLSWSNWTLKAPLYWLNTRNQNNIYRDSVRPMTAAPLKKNDWRGIRTQLFVNQIKGQLRSTVEKISQRIWIAHNRRKP